MTIDVRLVPRVQTETENENEKEAEFIQRMDCRNALTGDKGGGMAQVKIIANV